MENDKFVIWVSNVPVPVSKTVYEAYYKSKRREKYLEEMDVANGTVSYNNLDTELLLGIDLIVDENANVEDMVMRRLILKKLNACLAKLTLEELKIIYKLFFCGKSERDIAKELAMPQRTINYRKNVILKRLYEMMQK